MSLKVPANIDELKADSDIQTALKIIHDKLQETPLFVLRHGQSQANRDGVYAGQVIDVPITEQGEKDAVAAAKIFPAALEKTAEKQDDIMKLQLFDTGMLRTLKTMEIFKHILQEAHGQETPGSTSRHSLNERNWGALSNAPKNYIIKEVVGTLGYAQEPNSQTIHGLITNIDLDALQKKLAQVEEKEPVSRHILAEQQQDLLALNWEQNHPFMEDHPTAADPESLATFHKRTILELAEVLKTVEKGNVPVLVAHKGTIQALGLYLYPEPIAIQEPENGAIHALTSDGTRISMNVITAKAKEQAISADEPQAASKLQEIYDVQSRDAKLHYNV